jgi:hypothetical protein
VAGASENVVPVATRDALPGVAACTLFTVTLSMNQPVVFVGVATKIVPASAAVKASRSCTVRPA